MDEFLVAILVLRATEEPPPPEVSSMLRRRGESGVGKGMWCRRRADWSGVEEVNLERGRESKGRDDEWKLRRVRRRDRQRAKASW